LFSGLIGRVGRAALRDGGCALGRGREEIGARAVEVFREELVDGWVVWAVARLGKFEISLIV
jgi:hypothetical protein